MRRYRVKVSYDLDVLAKDAKTVRHLIEKRFSAPTDEWRDPAVGFTTNFRVGPASSDMKVEKIEPWKQSDAS